MVESHPVIVVGAGPVGLCLALALAQQDVAVTLMGFNTHRGEAFAMGAQIGDDEQAYQRLLGLGNAHVLGRIGTTTEIAEAFEYLARAEWTTGNILTVDGGLGLGVTNA